MILLLPPLVLFLQASDCEPIAARTASGATAFYLMFHNHDTMWKYSMSDGMSIAGGAWIGVKTRSSYMPELAYANPDAGYTFKGALYYITG